MTGYYSSSSSHCSHRPCRWDQNYHSYPCSRGFCCQKTVECTRIFVEGQLTLDANDNQIPCWPSIPNPKSAITGCERETQTIVDVEEIPSPPSLRQLASIAIPCITYDSCCQCCCKKITSSKHKSKRKTTPKKKTLSCDVYTQTSNVIVQQVSSFSQTDPPCMLKVGIQTEKPPFTSCSSQTQPKRTANKSTMPCIANLSQITHANPANVLNSIQTRSFTSLNKDASSSLCNKSSLQGSPRTNDILLSDWLPEMCKEMESNKKSRQELLKLLLIEERKQKKRLEMLKRKNQLGKAMSKFKECPKSCRPCSSDSSYTSSSSSPEPCEDLVLTKQFPLSLGHLESSSLPLELCQRMVVKRPLCSNLLSEAHKLEQQLPKRSDCKEVHLISSCAKSRGLRKECNYIDNTTQRIDVRNSLSTYNENFVIEENERNARRSMSEIFKADQNLEPLMNDCLEQGGNEIANSNLSPCLEDDVRSELQDHMGCQEILSSFLNRMAAHKNDCRLTGGGDKTIPVDCFPSCRRIVLSGSLSRINNCPLISHMRSMSDIFEKPASEDMAEYFVDRVEGWDFDEDGETGDNIEVPLQNESDCNVPRGLEEISTEENKLQKKIGVIPEISDRSDDDLKRRSSEICKLEVFGITDNVEVTKSRQTDALNLKTFFDSSLFRNISASCKETIQSEQKVREKSNQLEYENGTQNERRHSLQFNGLSRCCKKLHELKTQLRLKMRIPQINDDSISLEFLKERLPLHKMKMNDDSSTVFCSHFPKHHLNSVTEDILFYHAPHYSRAMTIPSKNASDSRVLKTHQEEHPASTRSILSINDLTDSWMNFEEHSRANTLNTFFTEQSNETNHKEFRNPKASDPTIGYQLPEEIHYNLFSGDEMNQGGQEAEKSIYMTENNEKTGEDDMKNYLRNSEETAELNKTENACVVTILSKILISRKYLSGRGNSFTSISPLLSGDSDIHSEQEEEEIKNEAWNNSTTACAEAIISQIQNANANDENIRYCYTVRDCAKLIISRAYGTTENPMSEQCWNHQNRAKRQHYHLEKLNHKWLRTSLCDNDSADNQESDHEERTANSDSLPYSPMGVVALFSPEHGPNNKTR